MSARLNDFKEKEDKNLLLEPGIEALNLIGMSDFIHGVFGKLLVFFDNKLMPSHIAPDKLIQSQNFLSKYSVNELERFHVYSPEYIKGPVEPFITTLSKVLEELKDINKLMLDPLEKWAATMLTDPAYGFKAWTTIPMKLVEVEKHKDELKKYFNDSVGDGINTKPIYEVYVNNEGLNTVTKLLEPMVVTCTNLLDGKLTARANSINSLMTRLVTDKNTANRIELVPDEKLKPIVDLTRNMAESLELLSVVMYHVKIASFAHQESLVKISSQLRTYFDKL